MRVINCRQRSEEWERLRARPTASDFDNFITPARGDYSASATDYAAQIVTKRLGLYVEPPPSFWMEWGVEQEPNAKIAYAAITGREVEEAGFVFPDDTDAYGGSPDGLVGDDGLLEVKCPAPQTVVAYHAKKILPQQYRPQVQGLLFITGRSWCDFFVWHPEIVPFLYRVEADAEYHEKIKACLDRLLEEITQIENTLGAF